MRTPNPRLTFESFVVGASNEFAYESARSAARRAGSEYNPLLIYGESGLGKTHLLHAIGNEILKRRSGRVLCVHVHNFIEEMIDRIRYDRISEFREEYRTADVLLLDEVQVMAGRERTQEEVSFIFDSLYEAGKQIAFTSRMVPKDIPELEEHLCSRFSSGLIVDIQEPDIETGVTILEKMAEREDIDVPRDVLHLLVNRIRPDVRMWEGGLTRLHAYSSMSGEPISEKMCRTILKDMFGRKGRRQRGE